MKIARTMVWKTILAVILLGTLWFVYEHGVDEYLSPPLLRRFLLSYGSYAPLIFLLLFALRPLFLVPSSILAMAGGLIFGPFRGAIYTVVGSTLGALLAYNLARYLGGDFVARLLDGKLEGVGRKLQAARWETILLLRLTPFLAADAISYGAGLFGVLPGPYIFGTLLGGIPTAFLFSYLGNSLRNPFSPQTLLLLFVYLLSFYYLWQHNRRRQNSTGGK